MAVLKNLSKITAVFSKNKVNVLEIDQIKVDGKVDVIIITDVINEKLILKTLDKINTLEGVRLESLIRVED